MARDNTNDPTPYAVICQGQGIVPNDWHGLVFLSEQQYMKQLSRPDSLWYCPVCGGSADWDDDCQATN